MRKEKSTVSLPSHRITSIFEFSHLYFTHCFRSVLSLLLGNFMFPLYFVVIAPIENKRYVQRDGTPLARTLTILIKIYENPFTFQLWMRPFIINIMNSTLYTKTHAWFIINCNFFSRIQHVFCLFVSWRSKNQFELQLNLIAQ